jgi:hypothetical protein
VVAAGLPAAVALRIRRVTDRARSVAIRQDPGGASGGDAAATDGAVW